jgi:hypothetical protein
LCWRAHDGPPSLPACTRRGGLDVIPKRESDSDRVGASRAAQLRRARLAREGEARRDVVRTRESLRRDRRTVLGVAARPGGREKAALRWLERYLREGSPRRQHFAEIVASLASREP